MSGFDNEVMFSTGERLEVSSAQAIAIMQNVSTDVSRINYNATPEGAIAANPSSLCHDRVAGNVYIKQTGTGNTGWLQVSTGTTPGALPIVSAYNILGIANATGDGTAFNPIMDSTFINAGTVYNTTTGVFTAPTTASYLYNIQLSFQGITAANTSGFLTSRLSGNNRQSTYFNLGATYDAIYGYGVVVQSGVMPLLATETIDFLCTILGGTKTVSLAGLSVISVVTALSITQLR